MAALELTPRQLAFLRSRAHALEPRLQLGKAGTTEGFRRQLEDALAREELVKVRVGKLVEADFEALAGELGAALVQQVGRNAVLYRPAREPRIELPGSA